VIEIIRRHRPRVVFGFVGETRHPDHHHAGELVRECIFLAGLEKIKTGHPPFRPSAYFCFPELIPWSRPDFVVDITAVWEKKMAALRAFKSQFNIGHVETEPPKTFLKSTELWELLEAKARMAGLMIGVRYGEPFYSHRPLNVADPLTVAAKEFR
jgi:LmbE family N-acetylglucosaminyl deacetylase